MSAHKRRAVHSGQSSGILTILSVLRFTVICRGWCAVYATVLAKAWPPCQTGGARGT